MRSQVFFFREANMDPTPEQKLAIERLYENESLTENLTDGDARALLDWAEQQIAANTDDQLVQAAVSAANQSGQAGVQSLLLSANSFLAQEVSARTQDRSETRETAAAGTQRVATSDPSVPRLGTLETEQNAPPLGTDGQAADNSILSARAAVAVSAPLSTPSVSRKKRRPKSKRNKK